MSSFFSQQPGIRHTERNCSSYAGWLAARAGCLPIPQRLLSSQQARSLQPHVPCERLATCPGCIPLSPRRDSLRQLCGPSRLRKLMQTGCLCKDVGHVTHLIRKKSFHSNLAKHLYFDTTQKSPPPSTKFFFR